MKTNKKTTLILFIGACATLVGAITKIGHIDFEYSNYFLFTGMASLGLYFIVKNTTKEVSE